MVEAPASRALRGLLETWAERTRQTGAEVHLVNCEFSLGGPWSGVKELIEFLLPQLGADDPEIVERHASEILLVAPRAGSQLAVANRSLTDLSSPVEKVRNYPMDRAFRIVQAMIDLIGAWRAQRGAAPLVLIADHYTNIGALARRFFLELMRRRGEHLRLTLVVVLEPNSPLPEGLEGSLPTLRCKLPISSEPTVLPDPKIMAERARALELQVQGSYAEGLENLPNLIQTWQCSGSPEKALLWQAQAFGQYNHLGFYEDALRHGAVIQARLDELLTITDIYTRWNLVGALANCNLAVGRPEEALRIIENEGRGKIKEVADRIKMLYVLALIHSRFLLRPDFVQAEAHLQEALELFGDSEIPHSERWFLYVFTLNGLAYIRFRQGRAEEAIELCRSGFDLLRQHLAPEEHRLHRSVLLYNMAQVYAFLKTYDKAIEHYTAAMELDPNYSEYYNERGSAWLSLGRIEEAITDYRRAIELSAPYQEVWTNLGQAYKLQGSFHEAVQAYSRALDLDPCQHLPRLGRAQTYEALGQHAEAIADYSVALEAEPNQPMVLANRATLLHESGRSMEALADLDRALALAPENADLLFNRAFVLADYGRWQEAERDLLAYLVLKPDAGGDCDPIREKIARSQDRSEPVLSKRSSWDPLTHPGTAPP